MLCCLFLCVQVMNSAGEESLISFDDVSHGKLHARLSFAFFSVELCSCHLHHFSLSTAVQLVSQTVTDVTS